MIKPIRVYIVSMNNKQFVRVHGRGWEVPPPSGVASILGVVKDDNLHVANEQLTETHIDRNDVVLVEGRSSSNPFSGGKTP